MSDPVERGKYLASLATCADCHTPIDETGHYIPGLEFAGGRALVGGWGKVNSANLTRDASGIPHYNEELSLQVMHIGNPGGRQLNPVMLWGYFRGMTDEDFEGNLCLSPDTRAGAPQCGQHRATHVL